MNKITIGIIIIVVIIAGVGFYFYFQDSGNDLDQSQYQEVITDETESDQAENKDQIIEDKTKTIIGTSVEGREIIAYHYGTGSTEVVLIGGIHGGYSWNTSLLAYDLMDYLNNSPEIIPAKVKVTVIPVLNPDGLNKVVGKDGRFTKADVSSSEVVRVSGRFNTNNVDLNRNFDCKWQPTSNWRGNVVSAGTAPFSEPEAIALRDFIQTTKPVAVVFWHSQSNAVYASECENGILTGTRTLMDVYAKSAGYPAVDSFTAYAITGDAEGWLASIGIPAITVELATHETIEWERNLAGVRSLFDYYSQALE